MTPEQNNTYAGNTNGANSVASPVAVTPTANPSSVASPMPPPAVGLQGAVGQTDIVFFSDLIIGKSAYAGWDGTPGRLQLTSGGRVQLYQQNSLGQLVLVFDCAPTGIKKFVQTYGILGLKMADTSTYKKWYRLIFSREANIVGGMSGTVSGGIVLDAARVGVANEGVSVEDNSGITRWVELLTQLGVKSGYGSMTNANNKNFNKVMVYVGIALSILAFIIGLLSAL
jgi:hypothetical protein